MISLKTGQCKKIKYRTDADALIAISKLKRKGSQSSLERYVYKCPDCFTFHITRRKSVDKVIKENEILQDRVNSLLEHLEKLSTIPDETEIEKAFQTLKRANRQTITEIKKEDYYQTLKEELDRTKEKNKQLKKYESDVNQVLIKARMEILRLRKEILFLKNKNNKKHLLILNEKIRKKSNLFIHRTAMCNM